MKTHEMPITSHVMFALVEQGLNKCKPEELSKGNETYEELSRKQPVLFTGSTLTIWSELNSVIFSHNEEHVSREKPTRSLVNKEPFAVKHTRHGKFDVESMTCSIVQNIFWSLSCGEKGLQAARPFDVTRVISVCAIVLTITCKKSNNVNVADKEEGKLSEKDEPTLVRAFLLE